MHVDSEGLLCRGLFAWQSSARRRVGQGLLHFAPTSNPFQSLIDSQLAHDLWASCNPSFF